jgi:hypothetical protein
MTEPIIRVESPQALPHGQGSRARPARRDPGDRTGRLCVSDGAQRFGQDDPAQRYRRAGRAQLGPRDCRRGEPGGPVGEQAGPAGLQKMGFVFQSYNLLANFTAHENVEAPMVLARVGRRERRERTQSLLERVGLADRAHHYPGELSGGQQRATLRSSVNITPRSM